MTCHRLKFHPQPPIPLAVQLSLMAPTYGPLVDHLRARVERLRVLSGATAASAYLPAPWPGAMHPLLLHTGTGAMVAELGDLERARHFHRSHVESAGAEAAGAALRIVASRTAGAVLLPVPDAAVVAGGAATSGGVGRRLRDREPAALAGWVGLVFAGADGFHKPLADDVLSLANSLAHTFVALHSLRSDPLTGLPGRAALHGFVADGLRHALDRQHPFSLALVNPDDFERVNERFGQPAGDTVLRDAVVRLLSALRTDDLVVRYGAATLAIVLPGTSAAHAAAVAEKARRALATPAYLAGMAPLAFSAGTATWQPGDTSPRDPVELLQRADSALAVAKQAGGNRTEAWHADRDLRSAPRLDRLGGVFTGDQNKDYRNLALLWDALSGAWSGGTPQELAERFAEQLLPVLHPAFVGVYEASVDSLGPLLASRGEPEPDAAPPEAPLPGAAALDVLRGACATGEARHVSIAGQRVVLAVPIKVSLSVIGALLLVGDRQRLRADGSDLTFLEGFASGMGLALDRARLAAQERDRLERERCRLSDELKELRSALHQVKLVYDSPAVEEVIFDARRVADTDATVLITGESGTGKGLLAQTIHQVSRRRARPFIVVDCSAIPPNLIESELFGHERGAFTGALTRSPGRIVQADGGTILLDEVGELPLEVQAKLLRFVEEKQLTSVGAQQARRVDVRVLAATNRDLPREVEAGRFRLDLYHRLSVVPLELPPLRARQADVLVLARHFLASFAAKYQKRVHRMSHDLEQRMLAYRWPGNVRELQNRLLRAVILADDDVLTPAHLPLEVEGPAEPRPRPVEIAGRAVDACGDETGDAPLLDALAAAVAAAAALAPHLRPPLGRWLADDLVLAAFDECQGVARRAAAALGVPETTYARRLQRAQRDTALGSRPDSWAAVSKAVVRLVRAAVAVPPDTCLLDSVETTLIDQIERRFPGDARAGATLLGTSIPTFRRRHDAMPLAV